ncbi:Cytochrome-c peroxidase [Methylocella silvestris BL2]|uniref:Cytochrome-c peroxidase n=1 Tax=Methylocella silvestris (strain DSM 15510 / CIP 108128 / LMG 27833 / NCIMB 13906 / BL2) TaxID=395965 RepID=B8EMV5_METSB|nr:Cytochrome-c peroxidase [Methylocella silvestris BL2]
MCLALLLLTTATFAQAPGSRSSALTLPTDPELITPIPPAPVADPEKLALGKRLFEDARLSHDATRSCASCHDVQTNGADANRRSSALNGTELSLNTNTVFNAALSFRLNWEGGFRSLEDQAEASLANPAIMGTSIDEVISRLSADAEMTQRFKEAYGSDPDRQAVLNAIATYERSLVTPGGRFDLWLGGEASALSAQEAAGYNLFKKFGCISCHQGVNIGANLFERHGIFHPLASPKPEILRVPSLRNVATTPPYFHDGSAPTLSDAVRKMGAAQLNRTLTDEQVAAIVAFLGTLTGTFDDHPVKASAP